MIGRTARMMWAIAGGVIFGATVVGVSLLPPLLQEIAVVLVKASAIAVAAYVVFVALIWRPGN